MNCGDGSCQIPDPQPRRAKPCCSGCGAGAALDALGFGAPPCCGATKPSGSVPREIAHEMPAAQWQRMSAASRAQWERIAARRRTAPSGAPGPLTVAPVPAALRNTFTWSQWAAMPPFARSMWEAKAAQGAAWRPSGDPVPAESGFDQSTWDRLDETTRSAWRQASTGGNAWNDYRDRAAATASTDARQAEAIAGAVGAGLTSVAQTLQAAIRADADRDLQASRARLDELRLTLATQTATQAAETQRLIAQEQTRQAQITADANAALARAREAEANTGLVTAQGAAQAQQAAGTRRTVLIGGGILGAGFLGWLALRGKR